eukprot:366490-Chlamydomonas_euryale.AAC.46
MHGMRNAWGGAQRMAGQTHGSRNAWEAQRMGGATHETRPFMGLPPCSSCCCLSSWPRKV